MDLRRLRSFVVLTEELHFGRAAARLHIAQPALSQQIRRLEHDLDVQLFERTHHRVTLTQTGALVLQESRRLLAQAGRLEAVASRASRGDLGRVSLGFVGSALYGVLPDLLRAVGAAAPDLQLSVRELETGEQVQALCDGTLDLGVLRPPVGPPELATREIDSEPLVAVVPVDHPAAAGSSVALQALADESFVAFPRELGPGYYDLLISGCQLAGFSPRTGPQVKQVHTMVGLVAAGMGVALVPQGVRRLQLPGVRYLALADRPLELRLALAWLPEAMTAAGRRVLGVAADLAAGRGDG